MYTYNINAFVNFSKMKIKQYDKPLLWNTERNWSQEESDQGLAPSATSSIRSELRLISLWSRVANSPQCRSRDLTIATEALVTKQIICTVTKSTMYTD